MHKKKKTAPVAKKMNQKQQDEEEHDGPTGRKAEQGDNMQNDS